MADKFETVGEFVIDGDDTLWKVSKDSFGKLHLEGFVDIMIRAFPQIRSKLTHIDEFTKRARKLRISVEMIPEDPEGQAADAAKPS